MKLEQYLKLDREYALKYDFYLEQSSKDCDRVPLMLEIYKKAFNINHIEHLPNSGDTMNTYRSKIYLDIKTFPKEEFDLTNRKRRSFNNLKNKNKALNIIIKNSSVNKDHIFIDRNGFVNNNYQLGNFIVLPTQTIAIGKKHSSINTERAISPNYDIFSKYLRDVYLFMTGNGGKIENKNLYYLFELNKNYYLQFRSFDNYIKENFLEDYFNGNGLIDLYNMDFEKYCFTINEIIKKRSIKIMNKLVK